MRDTTHIRFDRDTRRSRASAFVYALIAIGAAFVKRSLAVSSRRKVHARHPAASQQARSSCGSCPLNRLVSFEFQNAARRRKFDRRPDYSARGGKVNG